MTVKFSIEELEKIVHPDNLLDVLDSLQDNGKIESYYYDWECGMVQLDVPNSAIIEDLFKDLSRGKLDS